MSVQAAVGCGLIVIVLAVINVLLIWSWRSIDHIAHTRDRHVRQILKERKDDR
jgi:hypothetical protein